MLDRVTWSNFGHAVFVVKISLFFVCVFEKRLTRKSDRRIAKKNCSNFFDGLFRRPFNVTGKQFFRSVLVFWGGDHRKLRWVISDIQKIR